MQSNKSLYLAISDKSYYIDTTKLSIKSTKTFNYNNGDEQTTWKKTELDYKYDTIGDKPLCITTHYTKIQGLNKDNIQICLCDNENDNAFKKSLISITNFITEHIKKNNPDTQFKFELPITNMNMNDKTYVKYQFDTIKNYGTGIQTCIAPVHIHKTKNGGVVTINNKITDDMFTEIKMNCKNIPLYNGIKNNNNDIFYEVKTTFGFKIVSFLRPESAQNSTKIEFVDIKLVAKEIEIKYNKTYAISELNKNTIYVKNEHLLNMAPVDTFEV